MRPRTIVIGAGLSGLAAAFELHRAGREVVVLEASDRPGGVVGSRMVGGFVFERGPHTVLAGSAHFRRIVHELGLSPRLVRAAPAARTRWIWRNRALHPLPASVPEFVRTDLLSWKGKRRLASEPLRRFLVPEVEPTLGSFLDERLGAEASRLFAGAFVRGVYAAELDELGARSAFPRLWSLAAEHGSILRGAVLRSIALSMRRPQPPPGPAFPRGALVSFPHGLQELVDALARTIGPSLRLNAKVQGLQRNEGRWLARTNAGGVAGDAVVLAAPAPATRDLLSSARIDVDVAALRTVRTGEVTVVSLGFDASALPDMRDGFGFLVPPAEDGRGAPAPRALGSIFTSNLFPQHAPSGGRSIASFYRGADVRLLSDGELIALAENDLALALGSSAATRARSHHVERWTDVIPRYAPGYDRALAQLEVDLAVAAPDLALAGSHVGGVSVDQVIATGRAAARALHARLQEERA
jgi:oxygen-dependent protoporphyrinogen oxidase